MKDHINPGQLLFQGPPRADYDANIVAAYTRWVEWEGGPTDGWIGGNHESWVFAVSFMTVFGFAPHLSLCVCLLSHHTPCAIIMFHRTGVRDELTPDVELGFIMGPPVRD